ncbi:MAG: hypothetical protein NTX86_04850 [Candidatus Dependentiae bacterium]|nr:hypothetical protein [Candidatus Dependentiae bacterium]
MQVIAHGRFADYKVWYLLLAHLVSALLLDFNATIYSLFIITPLNLPDLGTIAGFLWFVCSLLILRLIIKHFNNGVLPTVAEVLSYLFTFGYGVYMVGNNVQAKMWILKYNDELGLGHAQPGVDPKLIPVFKLIYFYDEYFGHFLIYIPYFLLFVVGYAVSLRPATHLVSTPSKGDEATYPWWMYIVVGLTSMYFAWDAVEGQSIILFTVISAILLVVKLYYRGKGFVPGLYGKTVEAMFALSFIWILLWWGLVGHFKEMPQVLETLGRVLKIT